jgi:DNA topoisomerase-1
VALRFIVEREEEIERFKPTSHWTLAFKFEVGEREFVAKAHDEKGKLIKFSSLEEVKRFLSEHGVDPKSFVEEKEGKLTLDVKLDFAVSEVERKEVKEKGFPPFTTPALQSEAFKRFRFSPSKTMRLAQELYEGVEVKLPNGEVVRKGLITYMRTDSVRTNYNARVEARKMVERLYGSEFLPERVMSYKNTKKHVQDAHEAIRPTSVELTPEMLETSSLSEDHKKLYALIWRRFLASQTKPAVKEKLRLSLQSASFEGVKFQAEGWRYLFRGAREVYGSVEKETPLPELKRGATISSVVALIEKHETKPPARYNFRTLIEKLEKEGIGRPSTYAPTVELLLRRRYVVDKKGSLYPTIIGRVVIYFLRKYFPELVDYKFTSKMEERLDEIEVGKNDRNCILKEYYELLRKRLEEIDEMKNKERGKWFEDFRAYLMSIPSTRMTCPKCGEMMVPRLNVKENKNGTKMLYFYLSCPKEGCETYHMLESIPLSGTWVRRGGKKK